MASFTTIFKGWFQSLKLKFGETASNAVGYALGTASQILLRPLFLKAAQEMNAATKFELAGAMDYVEAYIRKRIGEGNLRSALHSLGFNDDVVDMLVAIRDPLYQVGQIQALLNRGDFTDDVADQEFMKLGYSKEEAANLRKLAKYIPSVPDFVRFAVREVFTPAVAEKYGQFQDYPEEFEDYAKKAGLDPAYAKYYWAAHWDLPSISMGFDMMHRGIITQEELATLLRTLDVMPYWRDKLIKLSETPFTRVDVRRMYKAGVLTEEEVKRAYMDLGYNEEKATRLMEFVVNEATEETRDLTKAEVLSLYRESVLDQNECRELLTALGYCAEDVEMVIALEDYKKSKDKITTVKNALHKSYLAGQVDRNDVLTFLGKYALPASEVQALLDSWDIEKQVKDTLPSRTDCDNFYSAGFINDDDYLRMVQALGYSEQTARWYLGLISAKVAEKEAKAKAEAEKAAAKKGG